jgi:ABC-type polysaccharide/polyol phosphate export permease
MIATLTQTGLEAAILIAVLLIVGNLSWTVLLAPFLLVLLGLFAMGVGFVVSLFNAYYRDVNYLVTIAMQLLFYGTPIIYPYSLVEVKAPRWIELIVTANPLTQFVGAARDIFYLEQVPSTARILGLVVSSVATFCVGWAIFARGAADVSEEL